MFKIHSIFPLFHFMMGFLALNFAAGDGGFMSAFEGGGDAPPPDMGDGESDGGDPVPEPAPADGEPKPGEEPAPGGKKDAQPVEPFSNLAKSLSKDATKAMTELKQSNPAAWKELNKRIYALDGIDKKISDHFDGGVDDAIKLKSDVDTLLQKAEADNIQEIEDELNGFRTIDKKLMSGDPTFLNELPPEMQEGLFQMMPNFVEDWRRRDNESYQRYFGAVAVQTLRDSNFQKNLEMSLWKLEEMGLDDPGVKKIHELLSGNLKWITDLDAKLKVPPEKKAAPVEDAVTAREKNVQKQELNLARTRIVTKFRQTFDSKMLTELKKVSAGTDGKIPANVNRGEVLLRAMSNLAKVMGSSVDSRVDQYLANKDEEGAFTYLSGQVSEKRLNEAITKAYRYLYGGAGAPKPAPTPGEKGDKGGAPDAPAGFVTINYDPKPASIDWAKTDALAKSMRLTRRQLISQNKCVLNSGKRVTWPRDAQAEE